jgi:hypothetical protein
MENDYVANESIREQKLEEVLLAETGRIKVDFVKEAYCLNKDKKLRSYIQNHQRALVYLIEDVNERLIAGKGNSQTLEFVLNQLHCLLCDLEKQFSDYFNLELLVPKGIVAIAEKEFAGDIRKLKKKIQTSDLSDRLKNIFHLLCSNVLGSPIVPYRNFLFSKRILKIIKEESKAIKVLEDDFIQNILFIENFNDLSFFVFLTDQVSQNIELLEDPIDKKTKLYQWQLSFKLSHQKVTLQYHYSMPSIKEQVLSWIDEKLCQIGEVSASQVKQEPGFIKLPTSLSVAQLAYFYRVLFDVGAIPTKNQKEISRFIASNFRTTKSDSLSVESLNSKYYNVEESTKAAVKDMVIKMLNTINRKN